MDKPDKPNDEYLKHAYEIANTKHNLFMDPIPDTFNAITEEAIADLDREQMILLILVMKDATEEWMADVVEIICQKDKRLARNQECFKELLAIVNEPSDIYVPFKSLFTKIKNYLKRDGHVT